MSRALGLGLAVALSACGSEPAPVSLVSDDAAPALRSLDYDFVTYSAGLANSTQALALTSVALGRIGFVSIDEPPLLVSSIAIEHMQLRSDGHTLSSLEPDTWTFLARRTDEGAVDALWFPADMPSESQSLVRFLVAQLQVTTADVEPAEEQAPLGPLLARYYTLSHFVLRAVLRVRCSVSGVHVRDATLFLADQLGSIVVGSGQLVLAEVGERDDIASVSVAVARRRSVAVLPASALPQLRAEIEALSLTPPLPLLELPISEADKIAMRRDAESWASIRARLLVVGDVVDPQLVSRAAAHLMNDEALVFELRQLAHDPATSKSAAGAMSIALGECGTQACQDALVVMLAREGQVRVDVLAGITRVLAPSASVADRLIELGEDGDDMTRAALGIVLARLFVVDPVAATTRVEGIVSGLDRCPTQLDPWFGTLGNAGLPAAKPALLACLDGDDVPDARRASAVSAMRRIPGADVTKTLVRVVVEEPGFAVRGAGLRALASRDLGDGELAPLVAVQTSDWGVSEQGLLLDVIERVAEPGEVVAVLLERGRQFENDEIAARATQLAAMLSE
ncbi:hypothetical protein [Enhygromyxa salina]|uniref:hypothetical protein n=1 Tax=Enhygromyxa salina TaxID=215803 RepID=UPI0011B2773B|nr:hypothetical protein [Enhygromyxa salina]